MNVYIGELVVRTRVNHTPMCDLAWDWASEVIPRVAGSAGNAPAVAGDRCRASRTHYHLPPWHSHAQDALHHLTRIQRILTRNFTSPDIFEKHTCEGHRGNYLPTPEVIKLISSQCSGPSTDAMGEVTPQRAGCLLVDNIYTLRHQWDWPG